jgi:acyl-CoA synthetase (AMP-forming)/AMP-acid ligase II
MSSPTHLVRIEDTLFRAASVWGARTAIIDGQRQYDFNALLADAQRLADLVISKGVFPGERVAMFLEKSYEAAVAFYGVWIAGAVAVPVNEGLKAAQVQHILEDSGARLLLTTRRKLAAVGSDCVGDVPVVPLDPSFDGGLGRAGVSRVRLAGGEGLAAILYTSGSTGLPKGIAISHANLLAGVRIVSRYLGLTREDRVLSVLPFSFDYGLNQLLTMVGQGGALVIQRSLLPADICRSLEFHSITGLAGVPTLWIQLMQRQSPFGRMSFPRLRYITNSGGVFPVELLQRYRQHLPSVQIFLMYGLTEAFRSTFLPPQELDRRPGSMGVAIPETEIRECGPNQVGQLVHSGPTVSLGYWNRPEATAAVFRPDPRKPAGHPARVVYSGDLVRRDEDGYLYFVGRADQQLKSYGFRISPEEVEAALYRSGLLAEVIVRGVPDDVAGVVLHAHVVPRSPETFASDVLLRFCHAEMPRYMIPREVHVYGALPRTASGKVDRKSVGES